VVLQGSFAAYGERRPSNWQGALSQGDWNAIAATTRRGFTGHEALDNVKLVHMNGRVFDPVIGRFLSADPYIDGVATTQGWNRFMYVHAQTLSAIDPSGYTILNSKCGVNAVCLEGDAVRRMIDRPVRMGRGIMVASEPSGVIVVKPKDGDAPTPLPDGPKTPSPLGETSCPAPLTFAQDTAARTSLAETGNGGLDNESVSSSLGRNAVNGALIVGGAAGVAGATLGGYYGTVQGVSHAAHFAASARIVLGTMSIAEGAATGAAAGATLGFALGAVLGATAGVAATVYIDWASSPELGVFEREDAWLEENCPQSVFRP
jgi:RHS repeat-associated protein